MIEKFTEEHYDLITQWYEARGRNVPQYELLSSLGFVCDRRAAGFIMPVANLGNNMAMIEGIISDPFTVPTLRRNSLAKLSGHLVDVALEMGYTNLFCLSKHPRIGNLCKQLGFKESQFNVYALCEKD